jgi:phage baseplate assembly protein gpV
MLNSALQKLRNAIMRDTEALIATIAQPRDGIVTDVDPKTNEVRVKIMPEGVQTGWIPDCTAMSASGGYGVMSPTDVGDQVHLSFAYGDSDQPRVIGRVNSNADLPSVMTATGKPTQSKEWSVSMPGASIHVSGGKLYINCTSLELTGDLNMTGNITVTGTIHATGDIVSDNISLKQHVHNGVQSGSNNTGQPV